MNKIFHWSATSEKQKEQPQKQWIDNIIFTAMNSAMKSVETGKNIGLFTYFWLAFLVY